MNKIVCLCGSTKFKETFADWLAEENVILDA